MNRKISKIIIAHENVLFTVIAKVMLQFFDKVLQYFISSSHNNINIYIPYNINTLQNNILFQVSI